MDSEAVRQEIVAIRKVLEDPDHRVIDEGTSGVLVAAEAQTHQAPKGKKWSITISQDNPLRFVESDKKRGFLRVDLSGTFEEPLEESGKLRGSLTIRLWSDRENIYFRENIDSRAIKEAVEHDERAQGRVMIRFHFENAMQGAWEPKHHFHLGGSGGYREDHELCWHPEWLDEPRFAYHPMNLILACEFVIANFFPQHFHSITREESWREALILAQREYVFPYFDLISECRTNEKSVLQHLCEQS
ncbi:MAG: hypothetical protein M1305_06050 [Candidatus Marsarchaeota archaeon]|nr:hypothetical protein [Candidatus Marsarchaeota archaeon]